MSPIEDRHPPAIITGRLPYLFTKMLLMGPKAVEKDTFLLLNHHRTLLYLTTREPQCPGSGSVQNTKISFLFWWVLHCSR